MDICINSKSLGYLQAEQFIFLKRKVKSESFYDRRHGYIESKYEYWEPTNTEIYFTAFGKDLEPDEDYGPLFRLIYIESITEGDKTESLYLSFHEFDPEETDDWYLILSKTICSDKTHNNVSNYSYMELLWALDNYFVNMKAFSGALKRLDTQSLQLSFSCLQRIGRCLSYKKQSVIERIVKSCGGNYDIYSPDVVIDLYKTIVASNDDPWEGLNLFQLLDAIFDQSKYNEEEIQSDTNIVATVLSWLKNGIALNDYTILTRVFPLLSIRDRIFIVKRYFHDIRLRNTELNLSLLEQFRYNGDLEDYARFRYCIETPGTPVDPSVPLLCDSLITLFKTNGLSFQTFNGVLDLYMTHCNSDCPDITLNLDDYLPRCNGGALVNNDFVGFITIAILGVVNNDLLQKNEKENYESGAVSISDVKSYIESKFKTDSEGVGIIDEFINTIYERYFIKTKIRIIPKKGVYLGQLWNLFKIESGQGHFNTKLKQYEDSDDFKILESSIVRNKIIHTIEKEYAAQIVNNEYFEIQYDEQKLDELKQIFYLRYNKEYVENKDEKFLSNKFFIENKNLYRPYCSPKLSEQKHIALDIPYYWCSGKECFRNALVRATLDEQLNWKNYTIYHMSEIMGFPKVNKSSEGVEVDDSVGVFIAIVNRAYRLFKLLKCRSCGHMLFSSGRVSDYNRTNFYCCSNPECSQYKKLIYLNYCHTCKKGIIDSRDTKQCPNGWYICPSCYSCCNDTLYEKQKQLYVNLRKPIPSKVSSFIGKGHNNKGQYYCPGCGELLQKKDRVYICIKCEKEYPLND